MRSRLPQVAVVLSGHEKWVSGTPCGANVEERRLTAAQEFKNQSALEPRWGKLSGDAATTQPESNRRSKRRNYCKKQNASCTPEPTHETLIPTPYSYRKASMGSNREARIAGIMPLISPTSERMMVAAINVPGAIISRMSPFVAFLATAL